MGINSKEKFKQRWIEAVEAYGTPREFSNGTYAFHIENPKSEEDLTFNWVVAPGYSNRRVLMNKQKAEAEARKAGGEEPRWPNDGNVTCFLCDNVGQSQVKGDNLILPFNAFENYVVLPNKYPAFTGIDSLLVAKRHDKTEAMIEPFPEDYLSTAVYLCEKFGFNCLRNHPRAGMSIPSHDHIQIKPRFIPLKRNGRMSDETPFSCITEADLQATDYGEDIFKVGRTRFDTLAIKGKRAVDIVQKLTNNLKKNGEIFTFYYASSPNKIFYVSIHKSEDAKRRIGAGCPLYMDIGENTEHPSYDELMQYYQKFLCERETFNWEKLF